MDYHKPNTHFPNLLRISDFVVTSRLGQLKNAKSSIVSTLSGMLIEVRLLQEENAKLLIVLTLGGMVMDVRQEQPENAQSPIAVTLSGMVVEVILKCSAANASDAFWYGDRG